MRQSWGFGDPERSGLVGLVERPTGLEGLSTMRVKLVERVERPDGPEGLGTVRAVLVELVDGPEGLGTVRKGLESSDASLSMVF